MRYTNAALPSRPDPAVSPEQARYIVGDAQFLRVRAQQWTECSELGAQSMHANGGHDQLDGLRLNACIAWKS